MSIGIPHGGKTSSSKVGRSHAHHRHPKVTPENQLSEELNNVKQLQGYRRTNITCSDIDTILNLNARLIETLMQPSLITSSDEYIEKFAELQRNLALVSRLADQPK